MRYPKKPGARLIYCRKRRGLQMHLRRGTKPGINGACFPPQDFGSVSDVPRGVYVGWEF